MWRVDLRGLLYYRGCCFMAKSVRYTHKALLVATVDTVTLPKVLRATLYGGVAILLSPVSPTLPSISKAPCLLFHSPLYLPEELPHFNINRTLHHAVAQTSPCCIAPVALAVATEAGGHAERMERR